MPHGKGESVPWVIHELLEERGEVSSGDVALVADVTRQAAHYHLRRLVEAGELRPVGAGRTRRYARRFSWTGQYDLVGLEEDRVWTEVATELGEISQLNHNAARIARYAFTEMLNNAIDHSGSEQARVTVTTSSRPFIFIISDEGVGAFEHVRRSKGLEDHVAAIQEISKGKMTTDPRRHSGQEIFFTSKCVDLFTIASNGWRWTVDNLRNDSTIGETRQGKGTRVEFRIDPETDRSLKDIMDEYTDPDTFQFAISRTVVRLFQFNSAFVSRSEAKRLTRNLDRFSEVIVDFDGVDEVGQAFADEVFRVWQSEHPQTRLKPVNMSGGVRSMVERARAQFNPHDSTPS